MLNLVCGIIYSVILCSSSGVRKPAAVYELSLGIYFGVLRGFKSEFDAIECHIRRMSQAQTAMLALEENYWNNRSKRLKTRFSGVYTSPGRNVHLSDCLRFVSASTEEARTFLKSLNIELQ
jgi:hypothetical protein